MIKQALIFAAGAGKRLHSSNPKPLLSVGGQSLISRQIELIRDQLNISEFTILVGFEADQIKKSLGSGARWNVAINYIHIDDYESGPALGLLKAKNKMHEPFLAVLGDGIYYDTDLRHMISMYDSQTAAVCGFSNVTDTHAILKNYSAETATDPSHKIIKLIEKPTQIKNNLLGLGLFIFNSTIFDAIEKTTISAKTGRIELIDAVDALAQNNLVKACVLKGCFFNINDQHDLQSAHDFFQTTSLIIPTLNEAGSISLVIQEFKNLVNEIVVVDNNSSDGTSAIAKNLQARVLDVNVGGYGEALQEGLKESKSQIMILMEGDHTFRSQDLETLISYLNDYDMVIGSRTSTEHNPPDSPMVGALRFGNRLYGKIIQALWPKRSPSLTDVGCTYRVIRKEAYNKIQKRLHADGPEFIAELTAEALNQGLRIKEVPVSYHPRQAGPSKHSNNYFQISRTALRMLIVILAKKIKGPTQHEYI